MPYSVNAPPERVKGLPKHAIEIWVKAFNAALKEYDGEEERANKVAWAAVKALYEQDADGEWHKKANAAHVVRGEIVRLAQGDNPSELKTIQVIRAGDFVDMHDLELTLTTADLDQYITNSNALAAREGIPIELGHPTDPAAPAAAWYKRFYKQVVDGVEWICAEVELSKLGVQSLADRLYKYFSATLDIEEKTITGGGFVNRPAVSGQQAIGYLTLASSRRQLMEMDEGMIGRMKKMLQSMMKLLSGEEEAPTADKGEEEMSKTRGGGTMDKSEMQNTEMEAQLAKVREEERQKALAERKEFDVQLAQARKEERERVLVEQKRTNEIAELSVKLTSGTRQFPYTPDQLVEVLGKLTDNDRVLIAPVFERLVEVGLVNMTEAGHARDGKGLKELSAEARGALTRFLAQGGKVDAFFKANSELGKEGEYDLSEFVPADNGKK